MLYGTYSYRRVDFGFKLTARVLIQNGFGVYSYRENSYEGGLLNSKYCARYFMILMSPLDGRARANTSVSPQMKKEWRWQ